MLLSFEFLILDCKLLPEQSVLLLRLGQGIKHLLGSDLRFFKRLLGSIYVEPFGSATCILESKLTRVGSGVRTAGLGRSVLHKLVIIINQATI